MSQVLFNETSSVTTPAASRQALYADTVALRRKLPSGMVLTALHTGPAGSVTQATSKSTGVTLNALSGDITVSAAALASATSVSFTLTNSFMASTHNMVLNHISGGTIGAYNINMSAPAAGSCVITLRNISAGSLSEAVVIRFSIIIGVTA